MQLSNFTALSVLDGCYAEQLDPLREYFSEFALLKHRLEVAINWFKSLAANKDISELPALSHESLAFLDYIILTFYNKDVEAIKELELTTQSKLKAIEYYLQQRFLTNRELAPYCSFINFACSFEDLNNIAYALMLKRSLENLLWPQINKLQELLQHKSHDYAEIIMINYSNSQIISATSMGKEFANFKVRLDKKLAQLKNFKITAKINGSAGNFSAHYVAYPNMDWQEHAKNFISSLQLDYNSHTSQIEPHDNLAELLFVLVGVNNILIDLLQTLHNFIALNYFNCKNNNKDDSNVKSRFNQLNFIDFDNSVENLSISVNLFNFLANTLPKLPLHKKSTESIYMHNLGIALGHSLLGYKLLSVGLNKLLINRNMIKADLDKSWPTIIEAIQTIMRKNGVNNAQEQLKFLESENICNKQEVQKFIKQLQLPKDLEKTLLELAPGNYTGIAKELAENLI